MQYFNTKSIIYSEKNSELQDLNTQILEEFNSLTRSYLVCFINFSFYFFVHETPYNEYPII